MITPATAQAAEKPCQLYAYHRPVPVRTQGHHRHPVYLQQRLWGEIRDTQLLYCCGTCHDSIHAWLDWLLGEARKPNPEPGYMVKAEAQLTLAWYQGFSHRGKVTRMIEKKVIASSFMAPLVLLAMYALGKLEFVQQMDENIKGALAAVLLGFFTFAAGWLAKHTARPDLGEPVPPVVP